jgi:hypothetical protein
VAQVQIDEAELLQYKQLHGAAQAILANPESRKLLHKAQKIVNPQARIPEVEIEEAVNAQVGGVQTELKALREQMVADAQAREAERQAAEINKTWDKQRSELRARGFTEDGIAKIEQHALSESIPNLRAAANDYLAMNPPPAPEAPSGFGSWDFFGEAPEKDTFVEKMIESQGDNDGVLNKEIAATLRDFRSGNQAGRF